MRCALSVQSKDKVGTTDATSVVSVCKRGVDNNALIVARVLFW